MSEHLDEAHIDERLDLTGGHWRNCEFDGCVLVLRNTEKTYMHSCIIKDCFLEGDGWVLTVLEIRL